MLQDVKAGRAIELEALVGAPRELARRAGSPNLAFWRELAPGWAYFEAKHELLPE